MSDEHLQGLLTFDLLVFTLLMAERVWGRGEGGINEIYLQQQAKLREIICQS